MLKAAAIFIFLSFAVRALQSAAALGDAFTAAATHALTKILLILVVMLVAWRSGVSLPRMGFQRGNGKPWTWLGATAVLAGAVTSITIIGLGLPPNPIVGQLGLAGFLVHVVLLSSIAEELLCRGLLQAELETAFAGSAGYLGISFPVWFSGAMFGWLHLTLLPVVAIETVAVILAFTTILGTLCAVARERTRSLGPPIAIHMLGNIGGLLGGILMVISAQVLQGPAGRQLA